METSVKNKWQIRLAVLLIFGIGFAAGALTMNVYRARHVASAPANYRGRFERMMEQLNLTAEQRDQVKAIFDDTRAKLSEVHKESEPRFHAVREQTHERLRQVLTPEQWEQFQKMAGDFRERRSHRSKRNGEPE
ncbi:MAG TPA: Spy/CpxP family protein refolding chaperone [Blastocatellia bacterium]|nr:Spy/CpxP family protein refolding chaperone [Blastocatellia bacterium]